MSRSGKILSEGARQELRLDVNTLIDYGKFHRCTNDAYDWEIQCGMHTDSL